MNKLRIIAAFACIYLVWGSTYMAIRYAVEAAPPFLVAAFRFLLAGGLLCLLNLGKWNYRLDRSELVRLAIVGLCLACLGNGLVTWSERTIASGAASLCIATVPLWITLLNWAFFERKRPGLPELVGVALGVAGVALLSSSDAIASNRFSALALLFSALAWSVGSLVQRSSRFRIPVLQSSALQMVFGGLFLLVLGTLKGEWSEIGPGSISTTVVLSILYLSVFGSIVAYTAYAWLLGVVHPQKVATYALVNPVVALALGAAFLGETVSREMIHSSILVLAGVGIVLFAPKRAVRPSASKPSVMPLDESNFAAPSRALDARRTPV